MTRRSTRIGCALAAIPAAVFLATANAGEIGVPEQGHAIFPVIFVNERQVDAVVRLVRKQNEVYIQAEDLPLLGMRAWTGVHGEVPLRAVPGVTYEYHEDAQTIDVVVPDDQLVPTELGSVRSRNRVDPPSLGAVVNYDLVTQYQKNGFGNAPLSGYLSSEQRVIGPLGVFSNVANYSTLAHKAVRYESRFDHTFDDDLTVASVGDVISGSLPWSRAVRMGGVRISRSFAGRPDLVSFPTPSISGSAVVPTSVDLLVNNMHVMNTSAPSGPFVINNVPVLSGAGDVVLVVKDQLGRLVPTTMPLYVDTRLLKKGLYSYDFSIGFLRNGYGLTSLGYGSKPVSNGSISYGLNNSVTVQGHYEAGAGLGNAGVGGLFKIGSLGVINANASQSTLAGQRGAAFGLGYQYLSREFSITANTSMAGPGYRDLGSLSTAYVARKQTSITVARSLSASTGANLAYVSSSDNTGNVTRAISASISTRIARGVNFSVTVTRATGSTKQLQVFGALSIFLDKMPVIDVASSHDTNTGDNSFSASLPPNYDGGFGFSGQLSHGSTYRRGMGRVDYYGSETESYAAVESMNSTTTGTYGVRGAITITDAGLIPSRYIYDSFGLVSTNGMPGVRVLSNNQPVGVTNSKGLLLVPNLSAYSANRVSIDQDSLPRYASAPDGEVSLVPSSRSFVRKTIPISTVRGARLLAVDEAGSPLRAGSKVVDEKDPASSTVVGYGGEIFLYRVKGKVKVGVDNGDSKCSIDVSLPAEFVGIKTEHVVCKR